MKTNERTPTKPWSRQATIDLLNADPLACAFTWPDRCAVERPVVPARRSRGGWGQWLAVNEDFPGLFDLIHEILVDADSYADASWIRSDQLRNEKVPIDSWSKFLDLELSALWKKSGALRGVSCAALSSFLSGARTVRTN